MSANFEHITLNVNGLSSDDDTKFIKFIDKFKKSKYHARFTQEPRHKRGKQHPRQNLENARKHKILRTLNASCRQMPKGPQQGSCLLLETAPSRLTL